MYDILSCTVFASEVLSTFHCVLALQCIHKSINIISRQYTGQYFILLPIFYRHKISILMLILFPQIKHMKMKSGICLFCLIGSSPIMFT